MSEEHINLMQRIISDKAQGGEANVTRPAVYCRLLTVYLNFDGKLIR
ncbi:hypothetical protein AAH446_13610 [Erwinia sp. P6884]